MDSARYSREKCYNNPIATILSVAMMCKYSLDLPDCVEAIENAVNAVLDEGFGQRI